MRIRMTLGFSNTLTTRILLCNVAVLCVLTILALLAGAPAVGGEDLNVPPEKIEGGKPDGMMHRYLLRQVDQAAERWKADYEKRKTPEEIAAYQKRLREKFLEAIGGLPERTPLEPQITGTISRPGYRVEKIIFQSQPKHYVTALLFLPDPQRFKPPYPGVIVPCGHAKPAKGHPEYQSMGALLALNGMAALVYDPIDQGERGQYVGQGGWPELWGCPGHIMVGIGSIAVGPQYGPIRDLGRDAGHRLSPIAARGRPAAHRLHGQQRRRHADELPDGPGRPHPRGGAELLYHQPAQAAGDDRPPGFRAALVRPIGVRDGPCRLDHDAGALAGPHLRRHQRLLRHRRHVGHFPLRQAPVHPHGICRARRHPGKRRRPQLQHPPTRRRGTVDVALALGQGSADHRAADRPVDGEGIPVYSRRHGDVAAGRTLGLRPERRLRERTGKTPRVGLGDRRPNGSAGSSAAAGRHPQALGVAETSDRNRGDGGAERTTASRSS